jgi:hypothetical protein
MKDVWAGRGFGLERVKGFNGKGKARHRGIGDVVDYRD